MSIAVSARWLTWLLLALVILGTGVVVAGAATIMTNVGMVGYARAVIARGGVLKGEYPLYGKLAASDEDIVGVRRFLQNAVALDKEHSGAAWGLGRVNLVMGDPLAATQALTPVQSIVQHNPFLFFDILVAKSRAGQYGQAIALFEANFAQLSLSTVVSDSMAFAYLEQSAQNPADQHDAQAFLALRPWDLYSNTLRWQMLVAGNDEAAASLVRRGLSDFSLTAIHPADERLLDYATKAIPDLYRTGVWDQERLENAVAFLVWQHYDTQGVEALLRALAEQYPQEARWGFYLGELFQRRGVMDEAMAHYELASSKEPSLAQAALRLGTVHEQQGDSEAAAVWYGRYRELALEDLAGLAGLVRVALELDRPDASTLRQELIDALDDQRAVAALLSVAPEAVSLGPNLLPEGDFEATVAGVPKGWTIADYATGRSNSAPTAAFLAGSDPLVALEVDDRTARIDGLWMQHPGEGLFGLVGLRERARGSYMIDIQPQTIYALSGVYRTTSQADRISVSVGNSQSGLFQEWLPSTSDTWRPFAFVGCLSGVANQQMQVLLSTRSTGQVWFDRVSLRSVDSNDLACSSLANTR